ncbi:MAG: hypothetical protein IPH55_19775 [Betaproteobacteria bacterium]|nr:hypothetical protein [Betaproteobacteria bacterium]
MNSSAAADAVSKSSFADEVHRQRVRHDFDLIMGKSTFSDRLKAQFDASNAAAGKAKEETKKLGLEYTATSEKADKRSSSRASRTATTSFRAPSWRPSPRTRPPGRGLMSS